MASSDNSSKPIVMKFGGTSVGDAAALDRSCRIVADRVPRRPFVIVSALAGTTTALLEAGKLAVNSDLEKSLSIIDVLERRHMELLPSIAEHFKSLRSLLQALHATGEFSARTQDLIAAYGEVLSSLIFTDRLQQVGCNAVHIDARKVMITDDNFGKASPLMQLIPQKLQATAWPNMNAGQVAVMGGYIGATTGGVTTTLGRGGSDYSAAIIGAVIDAEEIQIWSDVDGMMTADPRIVTGAWKIKAMSFAEASELAYFGAKVLHPMTVLPAIEKNIPVCVLNSYKPSGNGTRITQSAETCSNLIKAIACKRDITAVTISSSRMLMAHGFLRALFDVFDRHRTAVDVVATSEVSVSLTLDSTAALPGIINDIQYLGEVRVDSDVALICLVGDNLKYKPGIAHRVFSSIRDINVLMISHGASNINLSFVVDDRHASSVMQQLHAEFFPQFDPKAFEPPL